MAFLGPGASSWWEWFVHGAGGDQGCVRHPDDTRDFGLVPVRSLAGLIPFTFGVLALTQWRQSSGLFDSPRVVTLTLIPIVYLLLTPLLGMRAPDPGWGADPPKINFSLSHLIDCPSLSCLMSMACVYPCALMWAADIRADRLRGDGQPEGLIALVQWKSWKSGLPYENYLRVVSRMSLWLFLIGFAGFLTITDSTNFRAHLTMVLIFAAAWSMHGLVAMATAARAGAKVGFQLVTYVSALVGFVAFLACGWPSSGMGYWFWFAEVWGLISALLFTPARLLLDEGRSAKDVAVAPGFVSLASDPHFLAA